MKGNKILVLLYSLVFIFIGIASSAPKNTLINNKYNNTVLLLFLVALLSVSIYHIELYHFTDLYNYFNKFNSLKGVSFPTLNLAEEPLFYLLQWLIVNMTGSFNIFLVIVWGIIVSNIIKSVHNIFPSHYILYVLFSYFTFFIFFNYVLNVMRQGLAISFIILGVSYLIKKKDRVDWRFYIPIIIAPMFHVSALPVSIVLIVLKFSNIDFKWILMSWLGASFLFLTDLNSSFFSGLNIEPIEDYTSTTVLTHYSETNRLDFFIFSAFFVIISLLIWKYIFSKNNTQYLEVIKCYLIFNSYFLLLGFIGYSDRLAAYSWMLIPILIWMAVPNTKNQQLKTFIIIIIFILLSFFSSSLQTLITII